MQSLTIIAEVADGIGMFGFAVAGLFASAGRRIDPVGVFVSVFTTAFGGGIIRDILLDLRPFYWLSHPQWIWMTLGLTILAPVIVRRVQRFWQRRILLWADAVGLAFFAVQLRDERPAGQPLDCERADRRGDGGFRRHAP